MNLEITTLSVPGQVEQAVSAAAPDNLVKDSKTIQSKKSIHFTITNEAHTGLRIECFKRKLSMQEVFEEIAIRIAEESPDMIGMLDDLSTKKRNKEIEKLSNTDAESIFNLLSEVNPLKDENSKVNS